MAAASVGTLNEAARALQLKYSTALTGTTERKPRWEECTDLVSGSLGNAVGAMYVREYFSEDSKQSVLEMVGDLRTTFNSMIEDLDWMDADTRYDLQQYHASSSLFHFFFEYLKYLEHLKKNYKFEKI